MTNETQKHTPAPWYELSLGGHPIVVTCGSPREGAYNFVPLTEADKTLMLAAPDMAEALKAAENWLAEYESGPDTGLETLLSEIRAALAKAGIQC